jgi:hypothetical protein
MNRRLPTCAGVALLGFGLMLATMARAAAQEYRYCLMPSSQSGMQSCTFSTLQQCQATASGNFGYCVPNPRYGAPTTVPDFFPFGQRRGYF